jgi:hypothetical protein
MTRSIEPVTADPVQPLREPVAVQPEISRPLPRTLARSGRAASLSHGTAVDASILARLLGIPLLRLDAHIDMVPIDADQVAGSPMVVVTALPSSPDVHADPPGTLADAADLLQHAAQTLGEVRRERAAGR